MSEAAGSKSWSDKSWTSSDGLTLHYRDYSGPSDRPPLLCIPGLTRNARDFEPLAERFAGEWRMICVDLRGRSESDYAKDSTSYNLLQYVEDVEALLEQAGIARFVAVGTSLGGLIAMVMAERDASRIAGAVINDIGPQLEKIGVERIGEYVGQGRSFPTWMHAARALRESDGAVYPNYDIRDWLRTARQRMEVVSSGRIVLDYDMKIAEPFNAPGARTEVDLWQQWRALDGRPVLALRGGLSDLLSEATHRRMGEEVSDAELVVVADVGHPLALDEPGAIAAIARLLAKCT